MENGVIRRKRRPFYDSWWKNLSKVKKRLVIGGITLSFLLVLCIFIYLFISAYLNSRFQKVYHEVRISVISADEPEVCTSATCVRTSMELLNYMDIKVDPCEDFYRFSCGNFLQNTNLDNRESRSVRNIMEDEIQSQIRNMLEQPEHLQDPVAFNLTKKFYRACMNKSAIEAEGLERIKQIFEQMGGWPTLNGTNWDERLFDWKDAVYKLRQIGVNFPSFLILSVQRDQDHSNKYILNLESPCSGPSEPSADIKKLYLEYMVDIAVLMGAKEKIARQEQEQVMEFILKLAKISERRTTTNSTRYNLSELQYQFKTLSWYDYINNILDGAAEITYADEIVVINPVCIRNMLLLLNNTKPRIIANFMAWTVLENLIKYLPEKILDRVYKFMEDVNKKVNRTPRWHTCLNEVENRLPSVISAAYVEKYFDEEARRRALSMIRNIKYQFMENINKLEWMDGKTKDTILGKLKSSVEDIASYNDFLERNDEYNSEVEILEDKLLESVLNLDYKNTNIEYGKLKQREKEFFFENLESVTGLDIVYLPKENILRIPVGLFQGVLYQKDRPEYMNYGALGPIIAHEIYHIIIEAESSHLQGQLRSWWSPQSLVNYEEKIRCLSSNYKKFMSPNTEQYLKSSNISDEDMADVSAVKTAYDAYTTWVQENDAVPLLPKLNFSSNQLFWISSAIHHCAKYSDRALQRYIANYQRRPGEHRVNGALQNLDEFAIDFGCPIGTYMSAKNKCRIW